MAAYDAAIFTMEAFVPAGLPLPRTVFIPPAIDPLSTENMPLTDDVTRSAVASSGIDPGRPWVLQVSRFDPWKDPLGVLEAFRLARKSVPGLQLALVGSMAGDDPEGSGLLARLEEEIAEDPDIHVMTNLSGVGNMEVDAFQRAADLVLQKSLRGGFGLVVSESFWKERAMVCGRAGGIPMQYPPDFQRYLVDSVEGCAERMVELLRDPDRRRDFGRAAKEHVRRGFLLPRLLRDELRLFRTAMAGPQAVSDDPGEVGGTLTPASGSPARPTPGMPMP